MRPAKLFAGLAIAFSICAGLAQLFLAPSADLGVRGHYFAFGPMLVPLFCAVTNANFAVLYYAAVRVFHAQWNHKLSLLHFSLAVSFGISGSLVFPGLTRAEHATNQVAAVDWFFIPLLLGILSFAASFFVFLVNLMLLTAQIVRARFTTR